MLWHMPPSSEAGIMQAIKQPIDERGALPEAIIADKDEMLASREWALIHMSQLLIGMGYQAEGFPELCHHALHIIKDPILLENRTKAGPIAEHRPRQTVIVHSTRIFPVHVDGNAGEAVGFRPSVS